ncbi:hypothetical protein HB805_01725 [Listeria welshimeri]|nr:hypothetical protein [Listeria monocytogenes]MBC1445259.1 hypothetical protein [Listeria welshimeri]
MFKKTRLIIVMLIIGVTVLASCTQNDTINIGSAKDFSGQKIVDIESYPRELSPFFKYFQAYLKENHLNLEDTIVTIVHSENNSLSDVSDWTISLMYVRDAPARYNNRIYYQIVFTFNDSTNLIQEMTYLSDNPRESEQKKWDNQAMGYVEKKPNGDNVSYEYTLPTSMFFDYINRNPSLTFEMLEKLLQQDLKPILQ